MSEDARDVYELIEQLAALGADVERRVQALERRGVAAWVRRVFVLVARVVQGADRA